MRDYCCKEDGRIIDPEEGGVYPGRVSKGTRLDLRRVAREVDGGASRRDVALRHPEAFIKFHKGIERYLEVTRPPSTTYRAKEVICVIGPTGAGKTRWVTEEFGPDIYRTPINFGKDAFWFDGYEGQRTVLFDDVDGDIPYRAALRLCDGYGERVPVKGSYTTFEPERIVFTSEREIDSWWPERGEERIQSFLRRVTRVIKYALPVTRLGDNTSTPNLVTADPDWEGDPMPIDEMSANEFMETFGL